MGHTIRRGGIAFGRNASIEPEGADCAGCSVWATRGGARVARVSGKRGVGASSAHGAAGRGPIHVAMARHHGPRPDPAPDRPAGASRGPGRALPLHPTPQDAVESVGQTEALAHELSNMLDGSMRCLGLAERAILGPGLETDRLERARKQIETVQGALARMSALVGTAMRSPGAPLGSMLAGAVDPLTLLQSIRHAVQVSSPRAEALGAQITVDLDRECADLPAGAIYSVVLNGITNGLDSIEERARRTGTRHGRVDIVGQRLATGGAASLVQIEITDDGIGPPGVGDQVFEHGYTNRPGGSGIGLSVARSIVQRAGGRIGLEARHGTPCGNGAAIEVAGAILRIVWPSRDPGERVIGGSAD